MKKRNLLTFLNVLTQKKIFCVIFTKKTYLIDLYNILKNAKNIFSFKNRCLREYPQKNTQNYPQPLFILPKSNFLWISMGKSFS
jgi:hypothetical protein